MNRNLSPEEFPEVAFYHGTTAELEDGVLYPSERTGQLPNWQESRSESAYVTPSEDAAWDWAARASSRSSVPRRVYEVMPDDLMPDRNTFGGEFETTRAPVVRELPGPVGSQLALLPEPSTGQFFKPESALLKEDVRRAEDERRNARDAMNLSPSDETYAIFDRRQPQLIPMHGGAGTTISAFERFELADRAVDEAKRRATKAERARASRSVEADFAGEALRYLFPEHRRTPWGAPSAPSLPRVPSPPSLEETFKDL